MLKLVSNKDGVEIHTLQIENGVALADIEALINQIEDDMQRQIIQIEWQDATVFERNNSSLFVMAALMGLSSAQIDELWSQALTF